MEENKEKNLNLGCGEDIIDKWINIDINPKNEKVNKLDLVRVSENFDSQTIDKIKLSQVFQLFTIDDGTKLLRDCYNMLKPNGELYIQIPNLRKICSFLAESNMNKHYWLQNLYGDQTNIWEFNKSGYDYEMLTNILREIGFKTITPQELPQNMKHNIAIVCVK